MKPVRGSELGPNVGLGDMGIACKKMLFEQLVRHLDRAPDAT